MTLKIWLTKPPNHCILEMLLKNVHRLCLDNPPEGTEGSITSVIGQYEYWHYLCDNFDDRGWGCGYRTLQTISSWIGHHFQELNLPKVESIHKYQVRKPRSQFTFVCLFYFRQF